MVVAEHGHEDFLDSLGVKSREKALDGGRKRVKLVMMGGVRDEGDQQRLEGLKKLATELNIEVSFCPFFTGKKYKNVY